MPRRGSAAIPAMKLAAASNRRVSQDASVKYRGAQGLDPEFIKSLEAQFGFDKPVHERFLKMIGDYFTFNFGESYFRDRSVVSLIVEKMPVSISLGLWLTLITYAVSIPTGNSQGGEGWLQF